MYEGCRSALAERLEQRHDAARFVVPPRSHRAFDDVGRGRMCHHHVVHRSVRIKHAHEMVEGI
jgi:hypothetical protein